MTHAEVRELWLKDKAAEPNLSEHEFYDRHGLSGDTYSNACLSVAIVASESTNLKDFVRRMRSRKAKKMISYQKNNQNFGGH